MFLLVMHLLPIPFALAAVRPRRDARSDNNFWSLTAPSFRCAGSLHGFLDELNSDSGWAMSRCSNASKLSVQSNVAVTEANTNREKLRTTPCVDAGRRISIPVLLQQ